MPTQTTATQTAAPAHRGFRCCCPCCGESLAIDAEDLLVRCRSEDCVWEATPTALREMARDFLAMADWLLTAPEYPG